MYKKGYPAGEIAPLIPSPRKKDAGVCVATVNAVIAKYDDDMLQAPIRRSPGRKDEMSEEHTRLLIEIVTQEPDLYLDEYVDLLEHKCSIQYDTQQIYRKLRKQGWSLKVMTHKAQQRNERERHRYWLEVADLNVRMDQLCFFDETGQDERGSRRRRGWGMKNSRVKVDEFLHRGEHVSILAMYGTTGFIDFDYVMGGYDGDDVLRVFEHMIVPQLGSYDLGESNSVVVCDNCGPHRMYEDALIDMVEGVGARMLFLAAYSPIDNPIEMAFNVFKQYWKRERWCANMPLDYRIRHCMQYCYATPEKSALAAYEKCGYH